MGNNRPGYYPGVIDRVIQALDTKMAIFFFFFLFFLVCFVVILILMYAFIVIVLFVVVVVLVDCQADFDVDTVQRRELVNSVAQPKTRQVS